MSMSHHVPSCPIMSYHVPSCPVMSHHALSSQSCFQTLARAVATPSVTDLDLSTGAPFVACREALLATVAFWPINLRASTRIPHLLQQWAASQLFLPTVFVLHSPTICHIRCAVDSPISFLSSSSFCCTNPLFCISNIDCLLPYSCFQNIVPIRLLITSVALPPN